MVSSRGRTRMPAARPRFMTISTGTTFSRRSPENVSSRSSSSACKAGVAALEPVQPAPRLIERARLARRCRRRPAPAPSTARPGPRAPRAWGGRPAAATADPCRAAAAATRGAPPRAAPRSRRAAASAPSRAAASSEAAGRATARSIAASMASISAGNSRAELAAAPARARPAGRSGGAAARPGSPGLRIGARRRTTWTQLSSVSTRAIGCDSERAAAAPARARARCRRRRSSVDRCRARAAARATRAARAAPPTRAPPARPRKR